MQQMMQQAMQQVHASGALPGTAAAIDMGATAARVSDERRREVQNAAAAMGAPPPPAPTPSAGFSKEELARNKAEAEAHIAREKAEREREAHSGGHRRAWV